MTATRGITIVAIIFLLFGIIGFLWGFFLAGVGGLSWLAGLFTFAGSVREWGGSALISGVLGIGFGLLQILAGIGLLIRQYWGWLVAVVVSIVWLIGPLFGLLHGNILSIFALIIPGAILIYLLNPSVRAVFQRPAF